MYKEFLHHLEYREGNVDHVYLDSLGKPTCGVGHLLTEQECRQYDVGERVSQRTRDNRLDQDAQRSWDAAAQQLQELNIRDP